jgi:hypothetical protein
MAVENNLDLECSFCSSSYELLYNGNERPKYCAFCGEIIDIEEEEDDNWD